jgi:hypothetical protein
MESVMGVHTYEQAQKIDQIHRSLTNQPPTPEQIERIELLRQVGKTLGTAIVEQTPASREQSLAITKLEECVMWAVKAIVLEDD